MYTDYWSVGKMEHWRTREVERWRLERWRDGQVERWRAGHMRGGVVEIWKVERWEVECWRDERWRGGEMRDSCWCWCKYLERESWYEAFPVWWRPTKQMVRNVIRKWRHYSSHYVIILPFTLHSIYLFSLWLLIYKSFINYLYCSMEKIL